MRDNYSYLFDCAVYSASDIEPEFSIAEIDAALHALECVAPYAPDTEKPHRD